MQNSGVLFILHGGGQVFFKGENKQVVLNHIDSFIKAFSEIDQTKKEAILYADDEHGNHIAMVRCSQVIGFVLLEEKREASEAWKG